MFEVGVPEQTVPFRIEGLKRRKCRSDVQCSRTREKTIAFKRNHIPLG